jgi:putative N6-adenine-specific DNA methylase
MTEIKSYIAKTMHGLEPVLAEELKNLGATGIRHMKRAVAFEGDRHLLYRANYELRTALRILVPIVSFTATNERDYYKAVRETDWSQYMGVGDTLAVDAIAQGDVFRHSQYVGLLTKDAVVDQFRDKYHRRPNVNTVNPHLRLNVHVLGTNVDISLDSSGDSLHKRGYRRDTVDAPLNEVLAAGMILLSEWDGSTPFVDPMCGSGTIAIEAALFATNTPIQFRRENFGFFKWPDFDQKLWNKVVRDADQAKRSLRAPILASDIDSRARNSTGVNVMTAGIESLIRIEKIAFEKLLPPETPGTLITNPPYDERMRVEVIGAFYKSIGDQFKKQWPGWNAWLISSNREALKNVGLRTSKRITLFNGALECSFQKFELYEGTRKEVVES